MTLVACDRRLQGILATGVGCKRHSDFATHRPRVDKMLYDEDSTVMCLFFQRTCNSTYLDGDFAG